MNIEDETIQPVHNLDWISYSTNPVEMLSRYLTLENARSGLLKTHFYSFSPFIDNSRDKATAKHVENREI